MSKKSQKVLASSTVLSLVLTTALSAVPASAAVTTGTALGGDNRVETSVQIADKAYANWTSSKAAVIAYGNNDNLVDALAVAPLAYAKQAPIMLTNSKTALEKSVLDELVAKKVETVYIAGLSIDKTAIEAQLKAAGLTVTVKQLGGKGRIETANAINAELGSTSKVALVNGYAVIDALSVASIAAHDGMSIVLTNKDGSLPTGTDLTGKTVYAIGGTGVIPQATVDAVKATRLGGNDRYETNAAVLKGLDASLKYDTVYAANGMDKGVDALPGSVLAAYTQSPIVLTSTVAETPVKEVITGKAGKINTIVPLGKNVAAQALTDLNTAATATNLQVMSVSSTNLKELTVTFNKEVNKDTVLKANFTIGGHAADAVELLDDNKTVVVTIADADVAAAQPASYAVVVQNVTDADGNKVAKYSQSVRVLDTTLPVAQSVQLVGPNKFDVTFSEPIKTTGTVKVNNGIYAVVVPAADGSNVCEVSLSASSLPDGDYSVKLTGFKDYAGFSIDSTELTLNYKKVASAPTASIKSATQTEVVVQFDRKVILPDTSLALKNYFYHTFTAWTPDSVTASADGKTYTLAFTTTPIPAGTANVTVKAKTANDGSDIVDEWGNKLESNIVLPVTVTSDTTAPTIKQVKVTDEKTVVLYFSEDINQTAAEDETNFTVKDSAGKTVTTPAFTNAYTKDAAKGEYKVTMTFGTKLTGGNYTVDVKNMADTSLSANKMTAVTMPFTITDLTAIDTTAVTATVVESASADDNDIIYVTYPEKMATTGENSVLRTDKYLLNGVALPDGSTAELFGTTGKVVKITIPDASAQIVKGQVLTIGRVADLAGNATALLSFDANNNTAIGDEAAATVVSVKQTDYNKVTIIVNKPLSVVLPSGFTTGAVGSTHTLAAIDSWKVNDDNQTEINATVDGTDASSQTDTSAILANFDVVANILVSETGVKMAAADVHTDVVDARAPKLVATTPIVAAAGQKITLTFTEALNTTYAALYANDIVIVDEDGKTLTAGVDYTTDVTGSVITVSGTGITAGKKYTVSSKATLTYIRDAVPTNPTIATPFTKGVEVTVLP